MVLPEIRLLQATIALAEELNFSRAAARLRIDQSTLSKRIHDLEDQLGLRLFVRNHHDVHLTEAGRHFVEEARSAILHAERAVTSATAAERGTDEILNIGRSAYIDPDLVATLLSIHLPLFPRLKLKLCSHYSHELARQVASGRLDMALVAAVAETPRLSMMTLAESSMYIALQEENYLASQKELHLEEMRDCVWILPAPHVNPFLYETIQTVASEKGVLATDIHHVMLAEEATELILAYKGVAFLTPPRRIANCSGRHNHASAGGRADQNRHQPGGTRRQQIEAHKRVCTRCRQEVEQLSRRRARETSAVFVSDSPIGSTVSMRKTLSDWIVIQGKGEHLQKAETIKTVLTAISVYADAEATHVAEADRRVGGKWPPA